MDMLKLVGNSPRTNRIYTVSPRILINYKGKIVTLQCRYQPNQETEAHITINESLETTH